MKLKNQSSLTNQFIWQTVDLIRPQDTKCRYLLIRDSNQMRACAYQFLRVIEIELPQAYPFTRDRTHKPQYIQGLTFESKRDLFLFLLAHEFAHLQAKNKSERECDLIGLEAMRKLSAT